MTISLIFVKKIFSNFSSKNRNTHDRHVKNIATQLILYLTIIITRLLSYNTINSVKIQLFNILYDIEIFIKIFSFFLEFQDVHVMMFFGFGFLMTFLKKYGFGAVSYNFMLSAVVIQWATLLNSWVANRIKKEEGHFMGDPMVVTIGINT